MGIGYACSATLARGGAKVLMADVNEEVGNRAVSDIKAEGGEAIFKRNDFVNLLEREPAIREATSTTVASRREALVALDRIS